MFGINLNTYSIPCSFKMIKSPLLFKVLFGIKTLRMNYETCKDKDEKNMLMFIYGSHAGNCQTDLQFDS